MSSNMKIAIGAAALAIVAIIATIFIVNGGFAPSGLYVTAVSGNVYIDNIETGRTAAVAGRKLSKLEIITVESGGKCTLTYQTKKLGDNNYAVMNECSQAIVSDDFSGKKPSELNVTQGTLIVNNASAKDGFIRIRTANGLYNTDETAAVVRFAASEDPQYTICHNFVSTMRIQLYDAMGNTVDKNQQLLPQTASKALLEKTTSRFETLNCEFKLEELDAATLNELAQLTAFVTLPYSADELKAAADLMEETAPPPLIEDPIQTADTLTTADTEPVSITMPEIVTTEPPRDTEASIQVITTTAPQTTKPPVTTTTPAPTTTAAPQTTAPPQTTPAQTTTTQALERYFTVTFDIDGRTETQTVKEGDNAVFPANPVKEGFEFVGWDGQGTNITSDVTIKALFEAVKDCTVTLIIGNQTRTVTVPYGGDVQLPNDIILDGVTISGWDRDLTNITEDCTITAVFDRADCIVTFNIDGRIFTQKVAYGGTAEPPFTPETNYKGEYFTGWSRALDNITSDVTIDALYSSEAYTVTIVIGNNVTTQTVPKGGDAVLPNDPSIDGMVFTGWSHNGKNITADTVITANFTESKKIVTVTIDNGGEITVVEIMEGDDVTLPTPRELLDKTFVGWSHDGKNIRDNITITAQYE